MSLTKEKLYKQAQQNFCLLYNKCCNYVSFPLESLAKVGLRQYLTFIAAWERKSTKKFANNKTSYQLNET